MSATSAHDGEATGLAVCAEVCVVRLRPGLADVAMSIVRGVLVVAGLLVALWVGSVVMASSASAAVVLPAASTASTAKGGKGNSSGGGEKSGSSEKSSKEKSSKSSKEKS